jgi:predicted nucleotidyltransferase component of viral defense system
MIDRAAIVNWSVTHPWTRDAFVEQDLVISRALVCVFSDPFLARALAFRGGTALHKLHLSPQVRYSEDIDLVQLAPGPVKPIVERLDEALAWLPGKSFDARRFGFRLKFRFPSETPPVEPLHLKVEINTTEHFSAFPLVSLPFRVQNPWFSGECSITTYRLEELLATKFRALYQRKKGRDLFDLAHALDRPGLDIDAILGAWRLYMGRDGAKPPSAAEFSLNLESKAASPDYAADVPWLLRPGVSFDFPGALATVRRVLVEQLETKEPLGTRKRGAGL